MPAFINEIGVRAVVYNVAGFTGAMGQVRREVALTSGSIVQLSAASARNATALGSLGLVVSNFGNNIRTLGSQIANLGLRSLLFVTLPVAATIAATSSAAAEYEEQMTRINTITEATTKTTDEWSREILRLAPLLGQLPTELAAQQYFIASVGITEAKDALAALGVTAKLVASGLGQSEDVARAVAAGMTEFGLTAEQVGDQFLQIVREGAAEADTLAGTLGRVLAIAREVGLSFAEVGAFVATYTRSGVTAEVATTSLRSALSALLKPTEQTRDALAEVGLSVDQVRASIEEKGFARTLIGLRQLFGDNEEAFARLIGTQRGLAGVLSVTGEQSEEYLNILARIENSAGALNIAFEQVTQTFKFQWQSMLAAAQAAGIRIGNTLLPMLAQVVGVIRELITTVGLLATEFPSAFRFAFVLGAIAAAAGPLLFIFGSLIATFGSLIVFIGNLVTVGGALIATFLSPLGAILLGLIPIFGAFFAAFGGAAVLQIASTFRQIEGTVQSVARSAAIWGANIIIALANGMAQAAVYVINTVISIMNAVASLLRAQSPPKALPHLTEWGEAAMLAWLEGWTNADIFNTFRDISSIVTQQLRSIGRAEGLEPGEILENILGSRDDLARLFQEFRQAMEAGEPFQISNEIIQGIVDALGGAGSGETSPNEIIGNLIADMLALANAEMQVVAAQENLSAVQEHYSQILDPLRKRLESINALQEQTERQDRRAFLERLLVDPRSTAEVKKRAKLELEELRILDQIAQVERQEDAAVSAAEAQLAAAEAIRDAIAEQVAEQRALVDILNEEINLFGELTSILDNIANSLADAATSGLGGGGGAADDLAAGGAGIPEIGGGGLPEGFLEGVGGARGREHARVSTFFEALTERIRSGVAGSVAALTQAGQDLAEALNNLLDAIDEEDPRFTELAGFIAGIFARELIEALGTAISTAFSDVFGSDEFFSMAQDWFDPTTWFESSGVIGGAADFGQAFILALTGYPSILQWWFAEVKPQIDALGVSLITALGAALLGAMNSIVLALALAGLKIIVKFNELKEGFTTWLEEMLAVAGEKAEEIWDAIVTWFTNLYNDLIGDSIVPDMVNDVIDEIKRWVTELPEAVADAVGAVLSKFAQLLLDLVGPSGVVVNIVNSVVTFFVGLGGSIRSAIEGWLTGPSSPVTIMFTIGQDMLDGLTNAISNFNWVSWLVSIVVNALAAAGAAIVRWFAGFSLGGGGSQGPQNETSLGLDVSPFGPNIGAPRVAASTVMAAPGGLAININMGGQVIQNPMDIERLAHTIERKLVRRLS